MRMVKKSTALVLAVLMLLTSFSCLTAFADTTSENVFTKVTKLADITAGSEYVFVLNGGADVGNLAVKGTVSNSTLESDSTVAVVNDGITAPDASITWKLEASNGNFKLYNVGSQKYLDWTSKTAPAMKAAAADGEELTVTANDDGTFKLTVVDSAAKSRFLAYYASGSGFRWYNTSSYNGSFSVYKKQSSDDSNVTTGKTVYFTNSKSWAGTIYAHAWSSTDETKVSGEWGKTDPAAEKVETNDYGQVVYSYNMSSDYDSIIFYGFNNNTTTGQTVDVTLEAMGENNSFYALDTTNASGAYNVEFYKRAVEAQKYTVIIGSNDEDNCLVGSEGGDYEAGTVIDLEVIEVSDGYVFDGWYQEDTLLGTSLNMTYTVTGDAIIEARVSKVSTEGYEVIVDKGANGTLVQDPTGEKIAFGTSLIAEAKANDGYKFAAWTDGAGEVLSTDNPYTFTVNGNMEIYATYEQTAVVSTSYKKVTSASEITADGSEYVIVVSGKDLALGSNLKSVEAVAKNDAIESIDKSAVWTVEKSGDAFLLKNTSLDSKAYIKYGGSGTTASMADDGTAVLFELNSNNNFEIKISGGTRQLGYLVSSDAFKWYAPNGSNPDEFTIYKKSAAEPELPTEATTVYFTNNKNWTGEILVHAWKDGSDPVVSNGEWGVATAATKAVDTGKTNDLGQKIYSFVLDSKYDHLIFYVNNGAQTTDISILDVIAGGNNAIYLLDTTDSEGQYNVGYWAYDNGEVEPVKVTVTVQSSDETMGTAEVSAPADGKDYYTGEKVTFTATALKGYRFVSWLDKEDEVASTTASFTVTLEGDVEYTAVFEEIPVTADKVYGKLSSSTEFTAGKYVFVLKDTESALTSDKSATFIADLGNTVTNPEADIIWELEAGTADGTFTFKNGTKYIKFASSAFSLDTTATDITIEAADTDTVKLKGLNSGNVDRYIAFNSTFKLYAKGTTNPDEFYVYKLDAEPMQEETRTIYLTDNHNWGTIKAYAYLSTAGSDSETGVALVQNAAFNEAPEMTFAKENSQGQKIYSVTISKKYDTVIFHNGNGAQTVNISVADIFKDGNDAVWIGGMTESGYEVGGYWSFETPERTEAAVEISSADVAMGSVAVEPEAEKYYVGDELTVTATAADGYHFVNWTDADDKEVSTDAVYKVTLEGDLLLIANFERDAEPAAREFGRITKLSQITTGANDEYIFVLNGGADVGNLAATGTVTSSTLTSKAIADLKDVITEPSSDIVWKIEASGDNFILKNTDTEKYLDWTKSTTAAMKAASADAEALTVTANEDGTFKFTIVDTTADGRFLAYNNSNGFRWYNGASYNGSFYIYKLGASAPVEAKTVYLTDNHNWGTIRAYAYAVDADENVIENAAFNEAPEMTFVEKNDMGQSIYSIDIPVTYSTVIFHNGNGAQTEEILIKDIFADDNNAVWLADAVDGKYTVGGYYHYGDVEVTEVTVKVETEDETKGTVKVDPVADKYYTGDKITVTATAAEGYVFEGWYDADDKKIADAEESYEVTLTEDLTLTAKFVKESEKPTGTFVKVTDVAELTTGAEYVFILKDQAVALNNELKSTAAAETSADTILNPAAELIWKYAAGTDSAALMNSDGKYIAGSTSITRVDSLDTAAAISFTANSDGTFVIVNGTAGKKVGYLASSDQFKWYAMSNSNPDDFYIYKKSVPSTTVYITNNHGWDKVKVYAYTTVGETTTSNAEFNNAPEATLVFTNEQGQGVYAITISDEFENIVIHNGNGSQTVDIKVADITAKGNNAVWIDSTKDKAGNYNVGGYWKYTPAVYYTLTAKSANETQGKVTVDPVSEDNKYVSGTKVTLTAEPTKGYVFEGWYIDDAVVEDAKAVYELTVDKDITIEARFILEAQADKVFNKVTEVSQGNYILVMDNDGTLISYTSTNKSTAVTSSTSVKNPAEDTIVTLKDAGDGKYYFICGEQYIRIASSAITFTTDESLATPVTVAAGKTEGTFTIQAAYDGNTINRRIGYLASSDTFKWYGLTNSNPYSFYLLKENAPAPVDPDEPETFTTVYFTNNKNWTGDILVHAWKDGTEINNGEWGTATEATKAVNTGEKNDMGQEIYSFKLSSKYDRVIFYVNNGAQTVDIDVADITKDGNNGIYLLDTTDAQGYYNVGYWKNAEKFTVKVTGTCDYGIVDEINKKAEDGEKINLIAAAEDGYRFVGWFIQGSDEPFSTDEEYTYTVTGDVVIEGKFEAIPTTKYTVTVKANEEGGLIDGSTGEYAEGDKIKLVAAADTGYRFAGWYLEGSDKPFSTDEEYTYTVTGDAVIEGKFERIQVTHSVLVEEPENGKIDKSGEYTVNDGDMFTIAVISANEGYKFVGWSDDNDKVLSTDSTYSFVVNADAYIKAVFKKLHSVSVSTANTNAGTVSNSVSSKNSFYVDDNEKFTITATAKAGYEFAGWVYSGSTTVISTSASFTTSVTEDKQYVATFNRLAVTGDIDGDYAVTSSDLALIQNYLAGAGTLTAQQSAAADVNNDGKVDLMDAYIIYTLIK